jgi:hypothetical protein
MGIFRRTAPSHFIPVHPDNATKKDWVILLEAGTIVGPSPERLRVARTTLERKITKKRNLLLKARHFLVIEGYDPRIHVMYFCPQLYRYDPDKRLVPLQGEEIGRLIAQSLEGGVVAGYPMDGNGANELIHQADLAVEVAGHQDLVGDIVLLQGSKRQRLVVGIVLYEQDVPVRHTISFEPWPDRGPTLISSSGGWATTAPPCRPEREIQGLCLAAHDATKVPRTIFHQHTRSADSSD